jgi:hypothetical protein
MLSKQELLQRLEDTARELKEQHDVSVIGVALDYTEGDLMDHVCVQIVPSREIQEEHLYLDAVRAITMDVSNMLHTSKVGFLPKEPAPAS